MSTEVKFPDIKVKLVGQDGNAFMIIGCVGAAISKVHGETAAKKYRDEAMSGDYNNVLCVTARTVVVL